MKKITIYVKALLLCFVVTSSTMALAIQKTFIFSQFTEDSYKECEKMSIEQSAKVIRITVDLSAIKDQSTGLPSIVSTSGLTLSSTPSFFFMGIKDYYAYMSSSTTGVHKNKSYYGINFSLMGKSKYADYDGALRLNDAKGNACMILLK